MQKGKMFFNTIIIISMIALISIIAYVSYYYISKYIDLKEAEQAVAEFENNVIIVEIKDEEKQNEEQMHEQPQVSQTTTNKTSSKTYYKGYQMIGTIQIPKTKVKAPIVDKVTVNSISAAAAYLYGPGLNKEGNTVIVAHNYRNGTFFSNNKKLAVGDKIYITDTDGEKIEYTIYNTYLTSDSDFSYATRNTGGKREISLSTCTNDPSKRLVIWAKE